MDFRIGRGRDDALLKEWNAPMKTSSVALGALLAALSHPAKAQIGMVEGFEVARACVGGVVRLCAGVLPGDGRIKACVRDNMGNLSKPCHDAIQQDISAHVPQDGAQAKLHRFTS